MFRVHNPASVPLKLTHVRRTCTCSVVSYSSETILAGESQFFEFSYKAPTDAGDDRQSVYLVFDGTAGQVDRVVPLTVTAKVRESLTVEPGHLSFDRLTVGERKRRALNIDNFTNAAWDEVVITDLPANVALIR